MIIAFDLWEQITLLAVQYGYDVSLTDVRSRQLGGYKIMFCLANQTNNDDYHYFDWSHDGATKAIRWLKRGVR